MEIARDAVLRTIEQNARGRVAKMLLEDVAADVLEEPDDGKIETRVLDMPVSALVWGSVV
jgi:hypothetical protein